MKTAREVVLCEDCEHYIEVHYERKGEMPYIKGMCEVHTIHTNYRVYPNSYCWLAEERTGQKKVSGVVTCKYCHKGADVCAWYDGEVLTRDDYMDCTYDERKDGHEVLTFDEWLDENADSWAVVCPCGRSFMAKKRQDAIDSWNRGMKE